MQIANPTGRNPIVTADVCLIIEGAYPYVAGGVSAWIDQLIRSQSHLSFYVVSIVPKREGLTARYAQPQNRIGLQHITLQEQLPVRGHTSGWQSLCRELEEPLLAVQTGRARLAEIERIAAVLEALPANRVPALLDSRPAWDLVLRLYHAVLSNGSFSHYVWSARSFLRGLLVMLTAPVPPASVYHTITTGYAGLFAARAHRLTRRPVLLTEHGIYTNERRIELTLAEWLPSHSENNLMQGGMNLRDIWINIFTVYARVCYDVAEKIVTLYEENQRLQMRDGADPEKLQVIPNGIDPARFAEVYVNCGHDKPPTIALIGRVVPIKDVKTFIRAADLLRREFAGLRAWVMGPTDEDALYVEECKRLVQRLQCENTVTFLGQVRLEDYLGEIDVVVLTSLSEAQPLVVLEAGAAGVPMVTTNVGACREMILGGRDESPGGAITELASPTATAQAVAELLRNPEWRRQCGAVLRERVNARYNKVVIDRLYTQLYGELIASGSAPRTEEAA